MRKLGAPVGGTVAAVILVVLLGSTNLFDKTFVHMHGQPGAVSRLLHGQYLLIAAESQADPSRGRLPEKESL